MNRVLDTNAILFLLGGKLAQTLPAGEYFISLISEMELLSYPLLDESEQAKLRDFLSAVTVVDLTEEVKSLAIRLRRQHLLKLPDAIVAATARSPADHQRRETPAGAGTLLAGSQAQE